MQLPGPEEKKVPWKDEKEEGTPLCPHVYFFHLAGALFAGGKGVIIFKPGWNVWKDATPAICVCTFVKNGMGWETWSLNAWKEKTRRDDKIPFCFVAFLIRAWTKRGTMGLLGDHGDLGIELALVSVGIAFLALDSTLER